MRVWSLVHASLCCLLIPKLCLKLKQGYSETAGSPASSQGRRTWGAPFISRTVSPECLSLMKAMVYLSVGLKGMNLTNSYCSYRASTFW